MYMYSAPSVRVVRFLQRGHEVAQAHALRAGLVRADVELGVHVGVGEAVRREVEVGRCSRGACCFSGSRSAASMPSVRNLLMRRSTEHLLVHGGRVDHRARARGGCARAPRRTRTTGACATSCASAAQLVEIRAPVRLDARGIGEVALVQLLDERRVASRRGCCCPAVPSSRPWRRLVDWRWRCASGSRALRERHHLAPRRAGVELARAADLLLGSAIISFHCAIQPTVRASAKIAVNSGTGMPSAFCTMPE